MKHRVTIIVMAALVALALVSCDFMYETNFFATKMSVSADELASASVAELNEKAESESFFVALADDPDAKAAVLANLDGVIDDPDSTPEQIAEASALAAEILIYSSPAGELVGNVGNLLLGAASGSEGSDMTDPEAFIEELLPESVLDESGEIVEETFVAMINALSDSYGYFVDFSENMDPVDYTSGELGDAAMTAMMASIIASIDYESTPYESVGELLYAALEGEYTDQLPFVDQDDDPTTENDFLDPALVELFTAAGLPDLFPAEEPVTP